MEEKQELDFHACEELRNYFKTLNNFCLLFLNKDKRQSHLNRLWRVIHPQVEFLYWPKAMCDQNPFNKIWANINRKHQGYFFDLTELYLSWDDTRIEFDNFHSTFEELEIREQAIWRALAIISIIKNNKNNYFYITEMVTHNGITLYLIHSTFTNKEKF